MKIQTFTIVAGTKACNAKCPYCVSKMTTSKDLCIPEGVNWRNFDKACAFAKQNGVSTALITGKGEPTLYPKQVTQYVKRLNEYGFPFIELQTNGISLYEDSPFCDSEISNELLSWYENGLSTIALSVVHYDNEVNSKVISPKLKDYDLSKLIYSLHEFGFTVRLTVMMAKGYIDNSRTVEETINFCRDNKVEQLSIRSIAKPNKSNDIKTSSWVNDHKLDTETIDHIRTHLDRIGNQLMVLEHGAVVYDVLGQNVCLTNCLTIDKNSEKIRQLIFYPDGRLRYDWQYEGAILL